MEEDLKKALDEIPENYQLAFLVFITELIKAFN